MKRRKGMHPVGFCAHGWGVPPGAIGLNPMPLFHTAGCVLGVLGAVLSHATQIPVLAFEPGLVLDLIERERVSVTLTVPTMLIALMEHPDFGRRALSPLPAIFSPPPLSPAEFPPPFP